ncbi:MAG: hypothetical protein Q7R90_03535 [bacterium]|nr:hypothetical protein [bacterium]
MSKNPYLNALLASAYIAVMASFMYFGSQNAGGVDSVLAPIAMLSLLVLSVAVMGYLFFYQAAQLFMAGRAGEAGTFFLKTVGVFALVTFVFLALLFIFPGPQTPNENLLSVKSYVSQNISDLSPEKAVLGGTFYVTEIRADGSEGVVYYEDGHIALVADFTYTVSDARGVDITSFTVRK